ncbi:hypothetical protein [Bacillus sp. AFS075034]|uniref:hypothetical protein n=1 Tax=Bacillus sp. AFS075034 TaxID=2034281 RepID=UPI000BF5F845|nr:hypothetical protein [Bacillus sp. AFS075034]PFW63022.1 hypothetical protein COL20_10390 [Bacillus sp. AFS075034]
MYIKGLSPTEIGAGFVPETDNFHKIEKLQQQLEDAKTIITLLKENIKLKEENIRLKERNKCK